MRLPRLCCRSHTSAGAVVRIPTEPRTLGDHIRKQRLELKLMQKDVAERLGVGRSTVFNWEANTKAPDLRYMPAIIAFLGYDPLPDGRAWAARLVRRRTVFGMPQKEAAERIGVDQGDLGSVGARREREPWGRFVALVQEFLASTEVAPTRGAERIA